MDIHLHIERLVLDGLPLERAHYGLLQTALEAELTRLLAEGGFSSGILAGGLHPSLQAGPMTLSQPADPAQFGTRLAQSIYSGFGNPK